MAKFYYGSINLSRLIQAAKEKHSGFAKGEKSGDIFASVTVWENDQPDKYGNVLAIQVNPAKDAPDAKFYIGNCKPGTVKEPQALNDQDAAQLPDDDDLPF